MRPSVPSAALLRAQLRCYQLISDAEELNVYERAVMFALVHFVGEDGVCWPSHDAIAKRAGISRKTVCSVMSKLEQGRWVILWQRPRSRDRAGVRSCYRLNPARAELVGPWDQALSGLPESFQLFQQPAQSVTQGNMKKKDGDFQPDQEPYLDDGESVDW